jgi:hypothetical protein
VRQRLGRAAEKEVEQVIGIDLVDGIERIVGMRFTGLAGIDAVERIEGILWIDPVDGVQRMGGMSMPVVKTKAAIDRRRVLSVRKTPSS